MSRPNHVRASAVAGALGFAFSCAATTPAVAQTESQGTPTMRISDRTLVVGHATRVSGSVDRSFAGHTAVLQFRPQGEIAWSVLAAATVSDRGGYLIRHAVPRNGTLRVNLEAPAGTATTSARQSAEAQVSVAPSVGVGSRRLHVRVGKRAVVRGAIKPGTPGVPVSLQVRGRRGWVTLDRAQTGAGGAFALLDRQRQTRSAKARVVVAGHGGLATGTRSVGRLNAYRFAYASWYGPGLYGGHLACGGTLTAGTLGVAHKTLPCGAKVTLRHNGRTIRVPVVDRGPYVGGREYDLTSATAQRLGFHGHGTLLATR